MEIITKRSLILDVADRWKSQYPDGKDGIYEKLMDLKISATEDDVALIIGNSSWTEINCDECGRSVDAAAQVGQEPDYESRTAIVCFPCLEIAVKKIRKSL